MKRPSSERQAEPEGGKAPMASFSGALELANPERKEGFAGNQIERLPTVDEDEVERGMNDLTGKESGSRARGV